MEKKLSTTLQNYYRNLVHIDSHSSRGSKILFEEEGLGDCYIFIKDVILTLAKRQDIMLAMIHKHNNWSTTTSFEGVTKVTGNLWTIMTRIKYGKTDARLPVTLPIEWAGDTPMVSMTDATIPGMGSQFSARVIFYGNRYAGTWQHGDKGGHMFGSFEKTKAVETPETK